MWIILKLHELSPINYRVITHKHIRMIAHKLSWKTAFLLGFRKRNTRARL